MVIYPEILEPKDFAFRYGGFNDHNTRGVIRYRFALRHNLRARERGCPIDRREKPIELLEEWYILHVTPRVSPAFDWQFNEGLFTNEFVEQHHVICVASRSVVVIGRANKVEVTH